MVCQRHLDISTCFIFIKWEHKLGTQESFDQQWYKLKKKYWHILLLIIDLIRIDYCN